MRLFSAQVGLNSPPALHIALPPPTNPTESPLRDHPAEASHSTNPVAGRKSVANFVSDSKENTYFYFAFFILFFRPESLM